MKLNRKIACIAGVLTAASGAHAAMFTSLDWTFTNDASNPATPVANSNPSGATASAKATDGGSGQGYSSSYLSFRELGESAALTYGDQKGSWSVGGPGSGFTLNLNAYAATTTLKYDITITQFVGKDDASFLFPGNLTIAGATAVGTRQLVGTAGTDGGWYSQTWTGNYTPGGVNLLSIAINPTVAGETLSIDRIQWDITGDLSLVAVPEPMLATALTAVGLGLFGVWYRRKA